MKKPLSGMEIVNLDHLGIVAGVIDEMELVEEVNKKVGLKTKETISPGQVMKAMILNGLGFLSAPLYLFEAFFVGKATEHLIGAGVTPDQLNDDRIGRALDKYYQAGTTKLFTAIALKAAEKFLIKMNSVHLDSSSISVEGEYKSRESENQEVEAELSDTAEEMKAIKIVHGYSRDRRPDLKQFIIDTIVSGDGDVPLYLKIDDGNADDKSVFVERLKEFKKQWTFEGICVADSALYTAENLTAMAGMKWITRVPLSIKSAKNKLENIEDKDWEESKIKGYKIAETSSEYEWPNTQILVRGDSAYAREEIFNFCEKQDGVEYAIAMSTNSQLKLRANQTIEKAKNEYLKKLEPIVELMENLFEKNEDLEVIRTLVRCSTWYRSLCYQTEKSWSRSRRVVTKVCYGSEGLKIRHVVTSLPAAKITPSELYNEKYCPRGEMENRLKEQQLDLFADRTSTQTFQSNQLRLWFSSIAYVLMQAFRQHCLSKTSFTKATVGTIRLNFLKLGARITVSVRRILIAITSACPSQDIFSIAYSRIQAISDTG